jgi:hypothetical protein
MAVVVILGDGEVPEDVFLAHRVEIDVVESNVILPRLWLDSKKHEKP